jgi:GNAT superfamily N-acetyltransferase
LTGIEIVAGGTSLMDHLVTLGSSVFDLDPVDYREYLQWKHERNPYTREPLVYVALDDNGRAVGMRTFYGTRWSTGGGVELDLPAADDFAIATEHRYSGLASSLMRSALGDLNERGFEYVLSTSAGQVTVLQSLAMGWKSVGAMEPAQRLPWHRGASFALRARLPRRIQQLPGPVRRRRGRRRDTSGFEVMDAAGGRRSKDHDAAVVVASSPRDEALADLTLRLRRDDGIAHVRDSAFFRWRYANPSREYRFLLYEVDAELVGYLAVARACYLGSGTPLRIVDWVGITHQARAELLECAIAWCGGSGLLIWTASLPPESKILLERTGFGPAQHDLRSRGMPCVLLRKLDVSGEWLLDGRPAVDPTRWHVSLVDSMHG